MLLLADVIVFVIYCTGSVDVCTIKTFAAVAPDARFCHVERIWPSFDYYDQVVSRINCKTHEATIRVLDRAHDFEIAGMQT